MAENFSGSSRTPLQSNRLGLDSEVRSELLCKQPFFSPFFSAFSQTLIDLSSSSANQYKIRILSSNTQHSTWGKLEITFISPGANETFPLTSESDEIKDKAILQGLVVAHPIVRNISHVLLRYTKYRGWIYSGKDFWAVDKIILQDSNGEM